MKNFIEEFKAFALKGNVMDLAIAVVIGKAFDDIIKSVVGNILMPVAERLIKMASADFDYKKVTLFGMEIGLVIAAVINFIIIALFLFLIVKVMNKLKKSEAAKPPAEPPAQEKLLAEIRDLLAKK